MTKTLQFHGVRSPSTGPKLAITSWYVLCVAGAAWLTFFAPAELSRPGSQGRQVVLLGCAAVYIGAVLCFFLFGGLRAPHPIGPADVAGMVLY